jgi:hypothetical protein
MEVKSTHSTPRNLVEVSGQHHAPEDLPPGEIIRCTLWIREMGGGGEAMLI